MTDKDKRELVKFILSTSVPDLLKYYVKASPTDRNNLIVICEALKERLSRIKISANARLKIEKFLIAIGRKTKVKSDSDDSNTPQTTP